jgi:hypothetical protein
MEQTTKRRATSTAKAESAVKEAPAKQVKKSAPIKRKVEAPTSRVYQTVNGGGIVHMIQSKGITIFDEDSGQVREMRYCPNEPSIWRDEQSDSARKEAVVFRNGNLIVPRTKPNLMQYLDRHPGNQANGGNNFKLVDNNKDAQINLEKEFSVSEAIIAVRDKSIEELLPIAIYFGMNINRNASEIRFDLLQKAKKNPSEFLGAFDSPIVKVRALVKQCESYQIIALKNDGAYWFDSNKMIVANPAGHECDDTLARFLMTEKGATTRSSLEERLEKLG